MKNVSPWVVSQPKAVTAFVRSVTGTSGWSHTGKQLIPYTYDNPLVPYDSATRSYDYLTPQTNQSNTLNVTGWVNV